MRPLVLRDAKHSCCLLTSILTLFSLVILLAFFFFEKTPVPYIGWVKMAPLQLLGGLWLFQFTQVPPYSGTCPGIVQSGCFLDGFREAGTWAPSLPRTQGSRGGQKFSPWQNSRQAPLSLTRPHAWACPQELSFSKNPTESVYQGSPTLDIWLPSISEQISHPLPSPWRDLISLAHLSKNPAK